MVEAGLKLYFITFRSLDADTDWDLMTCAASPAKNEWYYRFGSAMQNALIVMSNLKR